MRNTVCLAVLLCVVDLHLTSGRHVNEDVVDEYNDVDVELGAPTEVVDTEVSDNSSALNHPILSREKRKAIKNLQYRWTQNEIPFQIDYSKFNSTHVHEIFKGMNEWQTYTCLRFRPWKQQDQKYVTFKHHESRCFAVVGMSHAGQSIALAYYCFNSHTILHEIGHAIGFYHEQSRPDRDQYITVSKNVPADTDGDVEIKEGIDTYGLPYDYESVMHYSSIGIDKNNRPIISTKNPKFQDVIGMAQHLSFYDVKLANLMYNCSQKCNPSLKCPSNGFLGPNCECWCPGKPIVKCDSSQPITVNATGPPRKLVCEALSSHCQSWKTTGECHISENYCPMFCSFCDGPLGQLKKNWN